MKAIVKKICDRIRDVHPDHHLIAKGMAWVALFVFFGKLAGAGKEMAIAARYGVGETLDAYLFIYNLVVWPVNVWFSVLAVVLIPLAARLRKNSPAELPRFRAELLGLTIFLGVSLILLFDISLPVLMNSHLTGLSPNAASLAVNVAPKLALLAFFGLLISLFSTWTMSAGRHVNTLLEGIPALTILTGLLIFSCGGIETLVWATLIGFTFHVISLIATLARRHEIEKPKFALQSSQWPLFWQGFGIVLAGDALMSFTGIIDQFFAGHLGVGAIATISYSNRILALILNLGAVSVSRATLPVFSKIQAQDDNPHRIAMNWMRFLFLLGIFALIINWWLAPWALKLIFERGAFTVQDTKAVTEVFRYALLQVPFYFSCLVLVSYLASRRKYTLIAIGAVMNLLIKVSANFIFASFMGIKGIVFATAIMYMGSFFMLYFFVKISSKGGNGIK